MRRIGLQLLLILALSGSIAFAIDQYRQARIASLPVDAAESSISSCFVPGDDCTQFIVDAIALAERELLVQAYNFTSPDILEALGDAKAKRNINVRVLLDKSNEQKMDGKLRYTGATYMANRGVSVLIDDRVAIAHNKVIIIDRLHVLTGSFNFTANAQKRNAENVILVRDAPELARRYAEYWEQRATLSRPLKKLQ
jgi:phosphatidylserine/phosphatidylglycerophosphate/cardiolipin synthase-like enzyme